MIRTLLLFAMLPFAAVAQLRIYIAPPNSETPAQPLHDMGSVPAGDMLEVRFRVRNHGSSPATVTNLGVAGAGFTVAGKPSLPYILASGLNLDFTVRFQAPDYGAYSANLAVNGVSVLLRATAVAAVIIRANGSPVLSGTSLDLGRVERGSTAALNFELANITGQLLSVKSANLTGSAFRAENLPAGADVAPGAALSFIIRFEPKTAGVFTGTLVIDGREIRLTGAATEPPFLRPAVVLDSFVGDSATQGRVSVRFPSPSRASGAGKLQIVFEPATLSANSDAGILFPSSGSRTIPFTVAEGDTEARFRDGGSTVFQTGTTAGTIVLKAEIGGFTEETSIVIPGVAVKFDQSFAAKSGNSLEVTLRGFDNTRSTGDITFTFFDRQGKPVQPGAIRVNAVDDFKRYFDSSTLGGTFSLRAVFPVAGNAAEIESVEVDLANAAGSSRTARLRF